MILALSRPRRQPLMVAPVFFDKRGPAHHHLIICCGEQACWHFTFCGSRQQAAGEVEPFCDEMLSEESFRKGLSEVLHVISI